MKNTLYYVLDPMCSWCWGFRPVFESLLDHISTNLPDQINIQYVMGGLAPDSDQPMPEETCLYIQKQWSAVETTLGAKFNWDFWSECQPRRSTYPACRAVIAVGQQGEKNIPAMIIAIQKAYYLQARNPSDLETLIELVEEIDLNVDQFKYDVSSPQTEQLLRTDFETRRKLGVNSFPTVLLETANGVHFLARSDDSLNNILDRL